MPFWQFFQKLADWLDWLYWPCPVSAALQNGSLDFFLFHTLIFIYLYIVRISASSFGHSDQDPNSVIYHCHCFKFHSPIAFELKSRIDVSLKLEYSKITIQSSFFLDKFSISESATII